MRRNTLTKTLPIFFRKIIYSILALSLLLSIITTASSRTVLAQAPAKHTVYLPLVSKNYQEWLDIFNQYRNSVGLNPVVANDSMNYGLSLHTKYLLLNPTQTNWHTEYSDKPGYTEAGKLAASQSNMLWSNSPSYTEKQSIDLWMATERHRYHMLNPYLAQSGFSLACDGINCFAGLNIYGAINQSTTIRNVPYPAENQTNIPRPNFPITWGFYPASSISTFNSPSVSLYDNSNKLVAGTINLHSDHVKELVFIPTNTLMSNHKYKVVMSMNVNGKVESKTWYFTTGQ